MKRPMTPKEEYEFYGKPENQLPQGPPQRRNKPNLTEIVPVRLSSEVLKKVKNTADSDDRSISSWIRRAIDHELERQAS